jgi:hypothetical protein
MGFLQNYLGLEPAYKDGYDLPLLGVRVGGRNDLRTRRPPDPP